MDWHTCKRFISIQSGKRSIDYFSNNESDLKSISENSVQSLCIDRSGVLWIGTFSQGLCKTDLYRKEFYHYKSIPGNTNSLSGNLMAAISGIHPDETWVGIDGGGVNRFIFKEDEEPRVIRYNHDPNNTKSLGGDFTTSLIQRKNGNVWHGCVGSLMSRITPGNPDFGTPDIIEIDTIAGWTFSLFEDSDSVLWGGTWNSGLWRYDDSSGEYTYYMHDPADSTSLFDNIVWAIYESRCWSSSSQGRSPQGGVCPWSLN